MMSKFLLLRIFLFVFSIFTVSCTQKRALSDKPSLLTAALCLDEEGSIRAVCLQSISTRRLIEEIYSRLAEEGFGKSSSPDRLTLSRSSRPEVRSESDSSFPEKRGREKLSGFYSNW